MPSQQSPVTFILQLERCVPVAAVPGRPTCATGRQTLGPDRGRRAVELAPRWRLEAVQSAEEATIYNVHKLF